MATESTAQNPFRDPITEKWTIAELLADLGATDDVDDALRDDLAALDDALGAVADTAGRPVPAVVLLRSIARRVIVNPGLGALTIGQVLTGDAADGVDSRLVLVA